MSESGFVFDPGTDHNFTVNETGVTLLRLEAQANYADAIAALKPVLNANNNNEFIYLRRGWLNYLQGEQGEAMRDYQRTLAINPDSLDARLGLTLPLLAQKRCARRRGMPIGRYWKGCRATSRRRSI